MARAASQLYLFFGLPGAGLIFLLEGLGIPIPVEIPLGIIGLRMVQGLNSYWQMVMLMFITTVFGNTTGYLLGYYGGRPLALKLASWFQIRPETWNRLESWFHRHGLKIVLATRWINWGFAQNMWLCGITRIPFGKFFAVMLINDFFWAMAWTWVAKLAAFYIRRSRIFAFLHASSFKVALTVLFLILLVSVMWWIAQRIRQRRR